MRRTIILALTAMLVAGSLGMPAQAGKKKAKPQKVTFHLHGTDKVGDTEYVNVGAFQKMDTKVGNDEKSRFVTNYVLGPNTACSGNALLPTWQGNVAGTIKGDVKVTLHTVSTPAAGLRVELYPDGTGGCDSALGSTGYQPPVAEAVVTPPPGPGVTEVLFEDVNFKTIGSLVMMLSIEPAAAERSPHQVRVFYDSEASDSTVELTCIPAKGAKSCV